MIIELIILLSTITSIVLSLLKLFTSTFDNFDNFREADLWADCSLKNEWQCRANINCATFTLGGNRNQSQVCRQSGVAMGAFGNSRIIRS